MESSGRKETLKTELQVNQVSSLTGKKVIMDEREKFKRQETRDSRLTNPISHMEKKQCHL